MITVKLKDNDKYTPSPFNPMIGSKYEKNGVLILIIQDNLEYININHILDIKRSLVYKLINHPVVIRWNNNIDDNYREV